MDRLQKLIAAAGLCSRRTAEEWIRQGRVVVNGHPARVGESADLATDVVTVDGHRLGRPPRLRYIVLNKPAGYVTTRSDPHAEHTVMELLKGCESTVFPVGRLDRDTEGLLILTNDGDLAFRLTHPSFGVAKVYVVEAAGEVTQEEADTLRKGVMLEDGVTAPADVRVRSAGAKTSFLEMTLHEGRKRQVRLMLAVVGHRVLRLMRIRYGPLNLGGLPAGKWRNLAEHEVAALKAATRKVQAPGGKKPVHTPNGVQRGDGRRQTTPMQRA